MNKAASIITALLAIVPQLSLANGSFSPPASNKMSYDDAEAYCKTQGGHLPSSREIANYAAQQGASGIKETSLYGNMFSDYALKAEIIQMASQGYRMIQKKALFAPSVDFYYSANGFRQVGTTNFWTSTTDSSDASLFGGKISQLIGHEEKYTLSTQDGSLGSDNASTGHNSVICSLDSIEAPQPVNSGSSNSIVSINPAQISFIAQDKTLFAAISDSNAKRISTIALDSLNIGRRAENIREASDYCNGIASQALSTNRNIKIDLSYKKLEDTCTISDEPNQINLTSAQ